MNDSIDLGILARALDGRPEATRSRRAIHMAVLTLLLPAMAVAAGSDGEPQRLIFDTDMGNDIDDALALGLIHALQSRGECRLLAVTVTKDSDLAAPFVDAINTFYGRGDIPVGVVRDGATPEPGKFLPMITQRDGGVPRYPHDLVSGKDAPDATDVLRRILMSQPDRSVVIVQVGFSTNLARLLASRPDDVSPLAGRELIAKKVRLLSIMAGAYRPIEGKERFGEYNVVVDLPSSSKLFEEWPTPIIASGYEIGRAILYPATSIQRDYRYVAHHPVREAYELYMKQPHDRPTWDLTSVLQVVRPARGYFDLSAPGRVVVEKDGVTRFEPDPAGRHRHLIVDDRQIIRVRETLVHLSSQPPAGSGGRDAR